MKWYRTIKEILAREPETWLAYFYGQQVKNSSYIRNQKTRFGGPVGQSITFASELLVNLRIINNEASHSPVKFLAYAGTLNQKISLDAAVNSIKKRDEVIFILRNKKIMSGGKDSEYFYLNLRLLDAFRSIVLFFIRGYSLYKIVKTIHPVSINYHFSKFCDSYIYLPYFYRLLGETKPEYVIVSNDHNVDTRCLIAVAHYMGVKTVYMQHASVGSLFPALRFNYAFLDGQASLDTYRLCEDNRPYTNPNAPRPIVLLTGQKKLIVRTREKSGKVIGVAINALDDINNCIALVNKLVNFGLVVCLRWHPGQKKSQKLQLIMTYNDINNVILSDPYDESVSVFLDKISWLVAANTGIHLEAAISGVQPIYYEFRKAESPDVYGFVKQGLVLPATSVEDIFEIIKYNKKEIYQNFEAIRHYSATYNTVWEGKEGDLVAECISCITRNVQTPVEQVHL